MRKSFILVFIFLLSCGKDKLDITTDNYTIIIEIYNNKADLKCYLRKQEGYLTVNLDSTIIKNQKVIFTGKVQSPQIYGIFIEGYKEGIFPIIEKGTINIKVDINDITNAQISGTTLNDQLADYKKRSKEISSKMNTLFHQFQKARAENNSEKLATINQQMKAIENEKNDYSKKFVKDNYNSFVASMVLHSLTLNSDTPKDTIAKLYMQLSKDVKKSEFSRDILLELEINPIEIDSLN